MTPLSCVVLQDEIARLKAAIEAQGKGGVKPAKAKKPKAPRAAGGAAEPDQPGAPLDPLKKKVPTAATL